MINSINGRLSPRGRLKKNQSKEDPMDSKDIKEVVKRGIRKDRRTGRFLSAARPLHAAGNC